MPKGEVSTAQSDSASMTLIPYIPESGFYNIYMMLPGCQNTNTCVNRASVKVQIQLSKQLSIVSKFKQDNVLDNEFLVHRGYIAHTSNDFKMTIKVSLDSGSVINALASNAEIVVDYFRMERDTSYNNLNGVIKFNKDLDSRAQDFGPIYTPLEMTLPDKSVVRSAVVGKPNATDSQDILYLGGRFSNSTANYHNVVQYTDNILKPLSDTGGVEGMVYSMAFVNGSLFVGGTFNGTADHNTELANVAQLSTTDNKWHSLGAGVNGLVDIVVPYAPFGPSAIALHGNFGTLLTNDNSPNSNNITVNGMAMWDMSAKQWSYTPYAKGTVTMLHSDPWKNHTANHALLAGSLSAVAAIEASGALLLDQKQKIRPFGNLGTSLQPDDTGKLALSTGLWYAKKNGTKARLVVGGQFKTPDGASNVAILDNGKWSRLMDDVDGEVLTINNAANLLFVGGIANTTGNKGDTYYSGLIVYDMDKDKVVDNIQELQGNDGDMTGVRVNKVAIRADTATVVVGGNFTTTGGVMPCNYICALDINERQWSPISNTLVDQVTDMLYSHNSLFVAGTFQNGTSAPILHLMQYSFDTNDWEKLAGASGLPGPVQKITPAFSAQSSEAFYITGVSDSNGGTPYLAMYDGSSVEMATFAIGSKSIINSILEVPLSRVPDSVLGKNDNRGDSGSSLHRRSSGNILSPRNVLAVSGDLHLPDGQRASSAFFYNNRWAPFLSSVQADGSPGFISSVFYEIPPASVYQRHRLSVALVILIAVAIALGITFLIVLVGLVYIYLRNRREAAATASAASAAMAATTGAGAGGGARTIGKSMHTGGGVGQAAATAGAGAGGALAAMGKNNRGIDSSSGGANHRDTWGDDGGLAAETVSFDNIAPKTDRLMSSSQAAAAATAGLAGLAAASGGNSRQGPVMSSETYVQSSDGASKGAKNYKDENNESLDSIFESAVAEADAEERERAASTGSLGEVAGGAAVAGGLAAGAAAKHAAMPEPHHYTSGNEQPLSSSTSSHSQTSMYRPDSTNPFEQRMAMRESQGNGGAFPPAGPFSEGGGDEHGMGHIPMPSPHHVEHSAELAAAGVMAGAAAAGGAKSSRHRSETESTRNTDRGVEASSSSHSLTSRPSGESSANGSSSHLPVRDSLKQYPVYYAKFTFNSRETGELGFRAGERVFVIDQSDEIWWMGIVDRGSDQPLEQGVFPATYVSSEPQKSQEWDESG